MYIQLTSAKPATEPVSGSWWGVRLSSRAGSLYQSDFAGHLEAFLGHLGVKIQPTTQNTVFPSAFVGDFREVLAAKERG